MLELNKIYCGDCLKVMRKIPDKSVDLVFADPPYNFKTAGCGMFRNRSHLRRIKASFGVDYKPEPLLNIVEKKLKVMHGYFWCSKDILRNYLNWAQDRGYGFNVLMWHKNNPIPINNNTFLPDTEYCVFIRGVGTTFNQNLPKKLYRRYDITARQPNHDHPTPKPLDLVSRYILISSKPGDVILDPYVGSGITCIAAESLGRKWIGIDDKPKYCRLSRRNIAAEKNQLRMFKGSYGTNQVYQTQVFL